MSKPTTITTKEMLEFIDDINKMPGWDWEPESIEMLGAIRALILNNDKGPEVNEEFCDKWRRKLEKIVKSLAGLDIKDIEEMLHEAGVEVEGTAAIQERNDKNENDGAP